MKKLLFIFTFCCFYFGYGQDHIAIEINNVSLKQALLEIEKQTTIPFYYDERWLEDINISINRTGSVTSVLNDLLDDTPLNYVIFDDKIILTNNSIVHTTLPYGYFSKPNENNDNSVVFYNQYSSDNESLNGEVVTIGKQSENTSASTFILTGRAINKNTKQPLSNLTLKVKGKNIYASTDFDGRYKIELPIGLNEITANLIGHQETTTKILMYGNGSYNFNLLESAETLDEVVIDAKKGENVNTATVGLTTIEVSKIKTIPLVLGERDILKVATSLPGIKTAGEGSAGYNVRGGRTDQNLILLDDALLYAPNHFLGFFTALNPFTTGNVDIYKASIPAQFGGRLSSVFDIETKKGNTQKFSGEGSIGPVTANIALETPIVKDKAALTTGIRATYSDWVLRSLDEASLKNSQASFYDAIVKYHHTIDNNNSLQSSVYFSKDKFSITADSVYQYNNLLASVKWNHNFNEKNRGELTLSNSLYKFNLDFEENTASDFDFGFNINETALKLNMHYNHSKQHKFSYGINSKLYQINPGEITPLGEQSDVIPKRIDKETGLESALFISDLFEVNDKLLFDIGLRYSFYGALGKATQYEYEPGHPKSPSTVINELEYGSGEFIKTYGGPEYRVSFRYFLTPSFSLKGGYNRTFQYIHLLSSNTMQSPLDTWKLSDLNTRPQRADQFSIGLFKNLDNDNVEISLEGYTKRMNNILDYKVGANLLLNENVETELLQGQGKAYGVEFLLKKKEGKLNGWIGYSYSRAFIKLDSKINEERVNNGDYFPANYDKPHDFSAVLNYKLTHRYSFSANFVYQTGRPITYPVGKYEFAGGEQVLYSNRNAFRIPDYYRLDLGLNIEGNHKIKKLAHGFWNISVYNVLGRNNPYSVYFVSEAGEIKAYQTSIFSIPVPTITYNFKF